MRNINVKISSKDKEEFLTLLRRTAGNKGLFEALIQDLLTPAEITEFAIRLQIVKRLSKGGSQRDISRELHISPATVTRGNRILNYGQGGFQKALRQ